MSRLNLAFALSMIVASPVVAQNATYTLYGTPGLIEMPTAQTAPDAQLTVNFSAFEQQKRGNIGFQITPRLSGTFRYTNVPNATGPGSSAEFERNFDLRYRFLDEGQFGAWTPGMAVGLQDVMGKGLQPAEYIVASKTMTDNIIITAGLGWGRFGSKDGFENPLGLFNSAFLNRPNGGFGNGGRVNSDHFFRGDAALFGGLSWAYSDNFSLKAEYSSDAYLRENSNATIDTKSPFNFGLSYHWADNTTLDLAYLYGSELAVGLTYALNPRKRPAISGTEPAPIPVRMRGTDSLIAQSWDASSASSNLQSLSAALWSQGIRLHGLKSGSGTATVRYSNTSYRSEAQAFGRVARAMTQVLSDDITNFTLIPLKNGMAVSTITMARSDVEEFENSATGSADLRDAILIRDAAKAPELVKNLDGPHAFLWGVSPYVAPKVLKGGAPSQLDIGVTARAEYELRPDLLLKGGLRHIAFGKRKNDAEFRTIGETTLTNLKLSHYGRPGPDIYSLFNVGYLNSEYGGISGEMIYKPVTANWALGAEATYAIERNSDMLFGLQDMETVTGHISGYYSFDNGFHTQLDVGKFLAGDWGATLSIDREFDNGWSVGAYATLTDMPFDEFGDGSFDKGVKITIPVDFLFGNASPRKFNAKLSSVSGSGGGGDRLNPGGNLYDAVRSAHIAGGLGDTFGRVWR